MIEILSHYFSHYCSFLERDDSASFWHEVADVSSDFPRVALWLYKYVTRCTAKILSPEKQLQHLLGVFYRLQKKRQVIYFKVRKINLEARRQKIDLWSSKKCWRDPCWNVIIQQKTSTGTSLKAIIVQVFKKGV